MGHVLCSDGIKQDPAKIAAIKDFPVPKTLKDLRGFLGLASYYRKFTDNFATVAAPLTDLTRGFKVVKGSKILLGDRWKDIHQKAFQDLKDIITNDVTLAFPDFNKPFKLSTDASSTAIGGVLSQTDEVTGLDRPITFFSRRLSNTERNYAIMDKEAFALIYGLRYNRTFIHGREITLVSDSEPLCYLLKQKNPSPRNMRWLAILSEYNVTNIKHLAGSKNIVPDILSRMNESNLESNIIDELPWMVQSMQEVNITTGSKAKISDPAIANHTPSLDNINTQQGKHCTAANQNTATSGQSMQTTGTHEMADDDASNDVTTLIEQQNSFKPYKDIISYLKGKSCSILKTQG